MSHLLSLIKYQESYIKFILILISFNLREPLPANLLKYLKLGYIKNFNKSKIDTENDYHTYMPTDAISKGWIPAYTLYT